RLDKAVVHFIRQMGVTTAGRLDCRCGVWVPSTTTAEDPSASQRDRKIAALGIRITRGVTMHGLALNCNNILDYYDHIIACGIDDADITTLALELGREVAIDDAVEPLLISLDSAPDPIKVPNKKARQARAQSSLTDSSHPVNAPH